MTENIRMLFEMNMIQRIWYRESLFTIKKLQKSNKRRNYHVGYSGQKYENIMFCILNKNRNEQTVEESSQNCFPIIVIIGIRLNVLCFIFLDILEWKVRELPLSFPSLFFFGKSVRKVEFRRHCSFLSIYFHPSQ